MEGIAHGDTAAHLHHVGVDVHAPQLRARAGDHGPAQAVPLGIQLRLGPAGHTSASCCWLARHQGMDPVFFLVTWKLTLDPVLSPGKTSCQTAPQACGRSQCMLLRHRWTCSFSSHLHQHRPMPQNKKKRGVWQPPNSLHACSGLTLDQVMEGYCGPAWGQQELTCSSTRPCRA